MDPELVKFSDERKDVLDRLEKVFGPLQTLGGQVHFPHLSWPCGVGAQGRNPEEK